MKNNKTALFNSPAGVAYIKNLAAQTQGRSLVDVFFERDKDGKPIPGLTFRDLQK